MLDCKQSNFRRSFVTVGKDFRKLVENLTGFSVIIKIRNPENYMISAKVFSIYLKYMVPLTRTMTTITILNDI